jgi:hypothetical protein
MRYLNNLSVTIPSYILTEVIEKLQQLPILLN